MGLLGLDRVALTKRPGTMPGIGRAPRLLASRAMSGLASALHVAMTALVTFMFPDWYVPNRRYRSEQHYMRGPGPKWRARRGM